MKKKSLLLMLLMALLVPWAANAQATLPIGDGTSYATSGSSAGQTLGSPFGNTWYYNSTAQIIYTASELDGAKTINSLAFYHNANSFSATVKIYLAHTTSSTIDPDSPATDGTLVYTGTGISLGGSSAGWQTFTFDTNFEYNGTDNLLVVVCRTKYNSGYSQSQGWQYTATTNNMCMSRCADTDAYGLITNTSYSYTATTNRPNVIIGYVPTTPFISLDPTSETVLVGLSKTITATYGNVSGTPTITYSSSNPKIASVSGSGTSATVTGESVGTATITATMTYNATDYTATCAVTVEEPSYCKPAFSYTSEYIKSFTTTGGEQNINNTNTGQGTGGYSNFYDTHFVSAEPETEIGFSVVRGYSDNYNYAIWVDWNKDYEFDNTTEKVAYTSSSTGDWTGSFTIPAATAAGDYHMRVIQVYSYAATPCVSASYGEGEDYKLTVLAGNPYQKPTDLTVIEHGPFNATIGWTAPSTEVVNYQYQYMPDGGAWTALTTTTALNAPLSGLTDETDYTFRVKAIYAGGESDFATKEFSTDVACATPTTINVTPEATSAQITWEGTATTYNLRYRQIEPVNVTLTAGDVWGDNSGYQMLLDADATAYSIGIDDYSIFEYKIPVDADNDTYTTHMVFENSITIQILGGTYDWFITNPSPGDQVYIAGSNGNVGGSQDDYVFEGGKTYEFVPSKYGNGDGVDVTITGEAVTPGAWTTVNGISGKSYTIPTLNPSSFYEVQVQAVCGGIYGESNWVSTSFSTPASCVAPENLAVDPTSITAYGATFTWTAETADKFQYCYVKDPTPGYTPTESEFTNSVTGGTITITHDFDPDSDYRFYLRRNCGGGEYSSIVSVAFHTDLSCYPPTDVTVDDSDITATTAIIEWTSSADNFDLKYSALPDGTEYKYDNGTATSAFKNCYGGVMFPAGEFTNDHIQKVTLFDYGTSVATGELYIYNGGTTVPEDLVYYSEINFEGTNDFADYFVDANIDNTKNVWVVVHFATSESVWKIPVCANTGDANGRWVSTDGSTWMDLVDYGSSYDYTWMIRATVDDASDYTWFNKTSTETTYPINVLTPSTNYVAQVRTNCGIEDGVSTWVTTFFTTMDLCPEPQNLTVSDETPHGATFSWTNGGSETEWHLYFSKENTAPADDINLKEVTVADSNPFTVTTGLDPETEYYVWVRANCGSTDGYSTWVGPETFTTDVACPAPTGLAASEITGHTAKLSWNGTSNSYILSVGTYDYTGTPVIGTILEEDFEDNAMQGWTTISNDNDSYAWSIQSGSSYAHESTYYVRARYTSSSAGGDANDWLISPQIPFGGKFSFYAKRSTSSELDKIQVYVSTTGKNISDFTAISEVITLNTTYYKYEYDLSSYSGNGYVAIVYTAPNNLFYVYVDDITITGPTYPIAWTDYDITTTSKTVDGLDPETPYFAKVKGNCGSEGYSQETAVISFTTDIPCPAPSALTPSNPTSVSFDLSWNNGGASDWIVAYKKTPETDFTEISLNISDVTEEAGVISYTLGGLDDDTEYTVKVRDNCEPSYTGDGVSDWTAEVTYSTIPACSAMNPVVSNITHHTAKVDWDGESTSGYTVKYRESALVSTENPVFYEAFNTNSSTPPTGWTRYSGLVDAVIAGSTSLTTVTTGWYTNSDHALGSYNAKLNIYGINVKHWLVTPEVVLTNGLSLSFDLALTDYGNGNVIEYPEQQPDDRFVVLVFADDAWHILREWNNSGSPYVYNTIATTGENVVLDLAAYAGKTIKVAFYGESTVSGASSGVDDNDLHIDNVLIGTTIPAGDWQTQAAATTTANLSGLTAGTMYDVKIVPNCDPTQESNIANFNTLSSDKKYFLTAGNWGTASNWMDSEIPGETDNVIIRANVNVEPGCVAMANNITFEGATTPTITIKDGGQLNHANTITATLEKSITGYGDPNNPGGWYLIATPVSSTYITTPNFSGTFDLYKYNEPDYMWYTWNSTTSQSFNYLYRNTGYLYAHDTDTQLSFTGEMMGTKATTSKSLSYTSSLSPAHDDVIGFNLIGNPFTRNLVDGDMTIGGGPLTSYYVINPDGDALVQVNSDAYQIKPGEGFFVQAGGSGQSVVFNPSSKDAFNVAYIKIVAGNEDGYDNACIQIEEGNTLRKMNIAKKTSVYVIDNGDDYAAATIYELAGTMPVHFKAVAEGEYTITVNTKNIEASTLLLFDNFKNETIDLLETPTYSFKSSADDPENRFKLIFDFNNNNNYNGVEDNFTSEIFVYQSGDELIVNGEGELQIFDVLGRLVTSKNISGIERVSKPAQTGVYIFRLNEHTQKLIIK